MPSSTIVWIFLSLPKDSRTFSQWKLSVALHPTTCSALWRAAVKDTWWQHSNPTATNTSDYRGFPLRCFIYAIVTTTLQLITISECGFTVHCWCEFNTRINVSQYSTVLSPYALVHVHYFTAVTSHCSHALQPQSLFALCITLCNRQHTADPLVQDCPSDVAVRIYTAGVTRPTRF
jgi:hypothetical protein